MKYIHVPTGVLYDEPHLSKLDINDFIRAELPEHWQIEGYNKSWEWAETEWNIAGIKNAKGYNVFKHKGFCHHSGNIEEVGFISRAEFEYHIYNPWKAEKKEPHYNHQPIEVIDMMLSIYGKEAVIHFCLLNSFKYRMRAGHKDDAVKDIEKAVWYEKKAKELEAFKTKEI
jgi:hypothetical protein